MPRAYDRRQLPVDRNPLEQLDTDYGKLPKFVSPFSLQAMRESFRNSLKLILGIDFNDEMPFLEWLFDRPFFTNILNRVQAARLLAQARIRAGTNLVSDPSVDNADFWQQYSTEQVDDSEVTPYQGDHCLKMVSLGENPVYAFFNTDSDGEVEPIKVRRGDVFIVESHIYAPVGNATGDVQLIGRVRNSRTEAFEDIIIDYKQLSGAYRGAWQKVSGTVEIPAGYDQFSAGLLLPADETTEDDTFFGDLFVIREVTDTHRLFALSKLFARRGSNLLLDPDVQDPIFWAQPNSEQVGTDVITPSSGDTALQITASASQNTDVFFNTAFNGLVEPITVRAGELFAVEARLLSPVGNTAGTLSLIAKFENSRSGAATTTVVDTRVFDADTQDSWQSMIGYARIPVGYNRLSVGVRIPAGQLGDGQHVYADELVMRETTAIRRIFDVLKLRSRRGGNLVTDSQIEDAEFWVQPFATQVGTDVVIPSSGTTALQVTAQGATAVDVFFNTAPDGTIDPINARRAEYYEVAARILSPTDNATGNVQLIARFENSRTEATTDVVVTTKQFDSAARGSWELVSGFVKVPTGYNRVSLGLRIPANQFDANTHIFADELVIHEATAAQRLKEILRLRIRRGSNLVTDSTFDDEEFWVQESTQIVDYQTVIPHGGNQSLAVTSRGATATPVYFNTIDDGSVAPIKVRHRETYEIAAYIYSPEANSNGIVSLTAQFSNSRTGNTTDVTVSSFTFTSTYEDQWVLVNGFVKVPLGYNHMSAGVLLAANETVAGSVFYVNEAMIRESTGVKRLLDLSKGRTKHGINLLPDANFEDEEFWLTQEAAAQVGTVTVGSTTVTPRTGDNCLQITSRGSTATTVLFNVAYDGSIEPIKARGNETYYLEAYGLSPASNAPATLKLIARLANKRTGATTDEVIDTQNFDTLTEDTWQQLSGYVNIPANRNLISAGVTLDANASTAGDVFFVDDTLLKEVTAAQRITDALFDGFNATTGSFGKSADDVLGSMEGVKDGQRALELARKRAKAGPNFVNDPRIEDSSYWSGQTSYVSRSELYYRNGGSSLEVTTAATGSTYAYWNTIDGGTVQPIATWEGDALYVQGWYFAPEQTGGGTIRLVVKAINSRTGAEIETVLKTVTVAEGGTWKKLSGTYVMPEGADGFSAGVKLTAAGLTGTQTYKVYFDALLIRDQSVTQRLVDVLWDGINGTSGTSGKDPDDLASTGLLGDGTKALKLARKRAASGNDFVTDPRVEEYGFWTQDSTVRSADYRRNGSYSLKITSRGSTPTYAWWTTIDGGTVQPLATWQGDCIHAQCWVYCPVQTGSGSIKLIARASNSYSGSYVDTVLDTQAMPENDWTKISGIYTVPSGVDSLTVGVLVDSAPVGYTFYLDSLSIREANAFQRLRDAARLRDADEDNLPNWLLGLIGADTFHSAGSLVGTGQVGNVSPELLANAGFDGAASMPADSPGGWSWDSSVDHTGTSGSGSAKGVANGTIRALLSNDIDVFPTNQIDASCYTQWSGFVGSGGLSLMVNIYDSAGTLIDSPILGTTAATTSSGWVKLSGTYTVPDLIGAKVPAKACITFVIPETVTGGTFWVDDASLRKTNPINHGLINGMQDAFDQVTGKSKARVQDFVDALQSYDSKKTGTVLDDFIPGVGKILNNGIRGFRGLGQETDTFSHEEFLAAAVGQSEAQTGNGNEIQSIWQYLNAGPFDEFERTGSTLGSNWATPWGSGNGTLQTEGHNACLPDSWPNGAAEYATRWVGTNPSSTSDYQQVSIVLASAPEKNLLYTGYNDVLGRVSGSTHAIRFRVGGDGSWSLSKIVSSSVYVMALGEAGSISVPGPGAIITLFCGQKSTTTPRWFKVKINSTTICDLAEPTVSGQPDSAYGSSYRGRGFGMRAEGLVFGANRKRPGLVNYWASSDQA